MKISIEFEDGRTFETDDAQRKTFAGLASKSAFKRQFGIPLGVAFNISAKAFDDDGNADMSQIPDSHLQYIDDEYLAFLAWLELKRRCDDVPDGKWETIVDQLVDVEVTPDEDDEDPTGAATST